jgi:hypothetical protein
MLDGLEADPHCMEGYNQAIHDHYVKRKPIKIISRKQRKELAKYDKEHEYCERRYGII